MQFHQLGCASNQFSEPIGSGSPWSPRWNLPVNPSDRTFAPIDRLFRGVPFPDLPPAIAAAAGIACAKSVCRYIYETYGRFPASVDAMHLMWFMQAHHLDVGYYRCHYVPDALSPRHAEHMAAWHGEHPPC